MESQNRLLERLVAENAGVDLHMHSTHSDGDWAPEALADDVLRLGGRILSLTDHDTVSGVEPMVQAAANRGMLAIPGIEVTLQLGQKPYHILCYDVDPAASVWVQFRELRQAHRKQFFRWVFEELARRGYSVSEEAAYDLAGDLVPHPIRTALWRSGHASTADAASQLFASLRIPLPHWLLALEVEEFGQIFKEDDGIAVVAHPARAEPGVSTFLTDADLADLRQYLPIMGVEAYHPYHTPQGVEAMLDLARRNELIVTTGSDAHGYRFNRPPRPKPAEFAAGLIDLVLARWRQAAEVTV